MAYINKDIPTMAMPKSFNRMGQFPLDMSSVFYTKKELEDYVSSNPIAYVGQIVSLVDEDNKKVTVYSIQNVEGDLQELGALSDVSKYLAGAGIVISEDGTISVAVDNETIEIVDGKLSAITPDYADTDTKTNIVSGDSYISIEGSLVENDSNTFTISIDESKLKTLIGATTTAAMEFKGVTDELKPLADKGDLYKVTSIIVVEEDDDAEGKGFIANVGDSIVSDGAGKWYLIPSGDDIEDTNDTYSAGNGIVISEANKNSNHTVSIKLADDEKNLKVNQNGLATNFDLADYATNAEAKADNGIRYINQSEIDKLSKLTLDGEDIAISGTIEASRVQKLYDNIVRIVTQAGTAEYDGEQKTLLNIAPGAEVNIIADTSEEFNINENRKLFINLIDATKISNLSGNTEFATVVEKVDKNTSDLATITLSVNKNASDIITVGGRVDTLSANFDAYKLQADASISELREILTWKDITAI